MKQFYKRMIYGRSSRVRPHNARTCELQSCLSSTLLLFRWIGFFPVEGIASSNVEETRFSLKSLYGAYYAVCVVGQITSLLLSIVWCFDSEKCTTGAIFSTIMYLTGTSFTFFLLNIARNWPRLLKKVAKIEFQLRAIRKPNNIRLYCNALLCVTFVTLAVENILGFLFFIKILKSCMEIDDLDYDNWTLILKYMQPQLFHHTSFSIWKFVAYKLANLQTVILCGVLDVIVMCVSVYLVSYFRDLNKVIRSHRNKGTQFWEKQRLHYTHLGALVNMFNEQLKYLILLSFITYLFFIIVQLFFAINVNAFKFRKCDENILQKAIHSVEHVLYYTCATMLPIIRALTTCLLAANVQIVAREPMLYVHEASDLNYNLDLQRFRLQMSYTPICLSGSLFSVTRNMILKVISTIITYELVLLQLNKNRRMHISVAMDYENTTDVF